MLNDLAQRTHEKNLRAHWWDDEERYDIHFLCTKLLLVHSEISEATEALRKNLASDKIPFSGLEEEIVDALIRIFDFAGRMKLDLDGAWAAKESYNAQRLDHTPGYRQLPGGKKF